MTKKLTVSVTFTEAQFDFLYDTMQKVINKCNSDLSYLKPWDTDTIKVITSELGKAIATQEALRVNRKYNVGA